jgi:hypothetical protein
VQRYVYLIKQLEANTNHTILIKNYYKVAKPDRAQAHFEYIYMDAKTRAKNGEFYMHSPQMEAAVERGMARLGYQGWVYEKHADPSLVDKAYEYAERSKRPSDGR